DRRALAGRSLIRNPYVYTLSIAVYCTAWTFYGSVGRAAETGVGFLPIYFGPTLVMVLAWLLLRRIVRITKQQRITSIADFIGSRYGKSPWLGGMVTVIAVIGIMPYISIQLEAIATSFTVLSHYPEMVMPAVAEAQPLWLDTSFHAALLLIVFAILFGTRHIDTTERHEGLVAAIAFESLVKLLAFLAVGGFVAVVMFDGVGEIFARAAEHPELRRLMSMAAVPGGYGGWLSVTFVSTMAFLFLPRQFHIMAVENVDEDHLRTAAWLFPLYLLVINLFVLSTAFAGLLTFTGGEVDTDTFVLALPMAERQEALALVVFLGGLSAATGMVIVETVALSTMICNDLVMPILLRIRALRLSERTDLSGLLLTIRRVSIAVMILLGDLFFRLVGDVFPLVTIGLLSFAAAAQFGPPILLGLLWRRANRLGAMLGLGAGFMLWAYTLLLPVSGWLPPGFLEQGPWGLELLRPQQLLGVTGLDPYSHGVFWSMLVNLGGLVLGSLAGRQDAIERVQASRFVDVFDQDHPGGALLWRGTAEVAELRRLVGRFIGQARAEQAFAEYARDHGLDLSANPHADPELVHHAERLLAGAIGAASARVMIGSIVKGEGLSLEEVMTILDETSAAIRYSRELERKSRQLEAAYTELREANERLKELDRMKDEFVATVSHELRTPLTSIRAFSEILLGSPDMSQEQRDEFLGIIVKESERLTRLINQVLDMAKMDAG
ncbi:MAG: histidine kinase dimerization/phospho-acceptor domain-containing protein, partial [Candidatus Competibacterales bacterium]|nr:histidine kinase dimerization/phospho-acceptor domain-containing protein [Candidatus Competibacterales bacterium]